MYKGTVNQNSTSRHDCLPFTLLGKGMNPSLLILSMVE